MGGGIGDCGGDRGMGGIGEWGVGDCGGGIGEWWGDRGMGG